MRAFVGWVKSFDCVPVLVAYPSGFDFMFVYWYMIRFAGESPFSFSALDVKSYASGATRKPYRHCTKRNFPKAWFPPSKHSHVAVEDAREQGVMFMRMRADNLARRL